MIEQQVSTPNMSTAPETGMRRPDGVIANAPSTARFEMSSSMYLLARRSRDTRLTKKGLLPAKEHAAVLGLTAAQMMQITGGRCQEFDQSKDYLRIEWEWKRDDRWKAQSILDFLYLGPFNMATNRTFLLEKGITKMISIRDSRFADVRMFMYDKMAANLGIEMECFDVPTTDALVPQMPLAVESINRHMLSRPVDANGASTGRVLVFCETGNIRSAAVVLAYIMSMYNIGIQESWEFAALKRHCIGLDEDIKRMLVSYEQLFGARRDVLAVRQQATEATGISQDETMDIVISTDQSPSLGNTGHATGVTGTGIISCPSLTLSSTGTLHGKSAKRSIEETIDLDDDRAEFGRLDVFGVPSRDLSAEPAALNLDYARYENRGKFQPFSDTSDGQLMR